MNRFALGLVLSLGGLMTAATPAWGAPEAWPAKPIRIIGSPEVRSRLTAQGAEVYTMSPAEFAQFYERERVKWAGVVARSGVKLD